MRKGGRVGEWAGRLRRGRLLPILVAGLTALVLTPTPAASASVGADGARPGPGERVLRREAQVRRATAEVDALSEGAGRALEAYQAAVRAQDEAQLREVLQAERLSDSQTAVRRSRDSVGHWARVTYQQGGALTEVSAWLTLLQGASPGDLSRNLVALQGINAGTTTVLRRAQDDQRAEALGTARAQAASAAASSAVRHAEVARQRSDVLVQAQRLKLESLSLLVSGARQSDDEARRRRALGLADQVVDEASAQAARQLVGSQVAPGSCQGADLTAYPNGMIDPAALCPLWGAPGQLLRADAASAFEAVSRAWAEQSGVPLCVSDSYRSLAGQVQVYATKPSLAARPGTSNHGWGVALDLCGGVQRFDSDQHHWLARNGPQFGWFHPQWARQGGSKPEAWHWEFAG